MITKQQLLNANVVPWIVDGRFRTERDQPIEFVEHRWAIDYLADQHPHKVSPKAAQAGMTVLEFMDDFHLVGKRGWEVAHTFHTSDVLQKIVRPKVNPLINNNPAIRAMMTVDSEGLKGFGKSFLHIIGANAESQAISFSADVLKIDEKDRSNLNVVEMLESRLKASKIKWIREFSNPSAVGVGVDRAWRKSDMRHWFVRCRHCNHFWYIDFEPSDEHNHYVDKVRKIYACGKCHGELSNADRIRGEWVAKFQERDQIHGYWISQLMCAWIPAAEIVADFEDKSTEYFYNFVLGKAYTPSDMQLDAEVIVRNLYPVTPPLRNVAMGVDVGKRKHVVIGVPTGIIDILEVESWEEIEYLRNRYDATMVVDGMPDFTIPQQLIRKYPGKVFMSYYVADKKNAGIVRWQEGKDKGVVHIDRTKAIDMVVQEIVANKHKFYFDHKHRFLPMYISHWANMYRIVERNLAGLDIAKWVEYEGKPDHFPHATVYFRVALEKVFGAVGSGVVETTDELGIGQKDPYVLEIGQHG